MRNICIKGLNITLLALITLSTLFSCTLDASASARTTELEKTSRVARMIDETLGSLMSESVAEALDEEGLAELMAITGETEGMDGRGIVARMLEGEDGREILDYTYLAITSQDADEILESARPLVDQDDYLELKSQTAEIKARAMEDAVGVTDSSVSRMATIRKMMGNAVPSASMESASLSMEL